LLQKKIALQGVNAVLFDKHRFN